MAGSQNRIEFTVAAKADTASFKALQDQLSNVGIAVERAAKKNGGMTQELKNAKSAAMELQNILNKSWNSNLGTYNMTTFSQGLQASGKSLAQYKQQLSGVGAAGVTAWNQFGSSVMKANVQVKEGNKLLNSMFTSLKNTVTWGISSSIFNKLTGSISQAYGFAQKLDSSLNDIRIVTGKSATEMKSVAQWANQAAKTLSASTTDLTNAALIYYQQGDSEKEAQRKAEITTKVANVTNQDTATAADQMTAIWNGFQAKSEDMESYGDKMAKVAAATASSFQELAAGMQKVAAASNTAGVSFDQLNAQMSTIVSVTREAPESVGTALKTIYARMGDLKTDGVATDESGFTTKLGTVTADMSKMGVNILDETGSMRELGEVIEEVGGKWQGWTRNQQEAAAVSLAGKRQYTQLIALFDNWDKYQSTLAVSQGAEGTLDEQQAIFEDRFTSAKKRLEAAKESIYQDLFNTDEATNVIEGITAITESFERLTSAFGGGTKALAAFGAMATKVFTKQINKEVGQYLNNRAIEQSNIANANIKTEMSQIGAGDLKEAQADFSRNKYTMSEAQSQRKQSELITAAGTTKQYETEAKYMQEMAKYHHILTEEQKESINKDIEKLADLERQTAEYKEQVRLISETTKDKELTRKKFSADNNYGDDIVGKRQDSFDRTTAFEEESAISASRFNDIANSDIKTQNFEQVGQIIEEETNEVQKLLDSMDDVALIEQERLIYENQIESTIKAQDKLSKSLAQYEQLYGKDKVKNQADVEKAISNINTELNTNKKLTKEEKTALNQEKQILEEILKNWKAVKTEAGKVTTAGSTQTGAALKNAQDYQNARREEDQHKGDASVQKGQLDDTLKQVQNIDVVQAKIASVTNAMSLLSSSVMFFHSLGSIWSDDDISTGEKIAQTLMSALPMLGMMISSYQGMAKAGKELALVRRKEKIDNLATAGSTVALTAAEEAETLVSGESAGANTIQAGSTAATGVAAKGASVGFWEMAAAEAAALAPILAIVAAVGLLGVGLYTLIKNLSDTTENVDANKKEMQKWKSASEEAQNNIDTLNTSLNTLQSSLDKMSEYEDVMDKFVEGTNKWQQAAQNLSQEIETLLQLYPELEQYVDQGADGLYHFKGKTKEEQEENKQQFQEEAEKNKNRQIQIQEQIKQYSDIEQSKTSTQTGAAEIADTFQNAFKTGDGEGQEYAQYIGVEGGKKYGGARFSTSGAIFGEKAGDLDIEKKTATGYKTVETIEDYGQNKDKLQKGIILGDTDQIIEMFQYFNDTKEGQDFSQQDFEKYLQSVYHLKDTDIAGVESADLTLFLNDLKDQDKDYLEHLQEAYHDYLKGVTEENKQLQQLFSESATFVMESSDTYQSADEGTRVAMTAQGQTDYSENYQDTYNQWLGAYKKQDGKSKEKLMMMYLKKAGLMKQDATVDDIKWDDENNQWSYTDINDNTSAATREDAAAYYAGIKATNVLDTNTEKYAENAKKVEDKLKDLGFDNAGETMGKLFNGEQLTREEQELVAKHYEEIWNAITDAFGEDSAKNLNVTRKSLKNIKKNSLTFDEVRKKAAESDDEAVKTVLTSEGGSVPEGYKTIEEFQAQGDGLLNRLLTSKNISNNDKDKIADIYGKQDWTKVDAVDKFKEDLEAAGIETQNLGSKFDALIVWLTELGDVAEDVSQTNINDADIFAGDQAADKITKGEQISEDEKTAIQQMMGNEWAEVSDQFKKVVTGYKVDDKTGERVATYGYEYQGDKEQFSTHYSNEVGTDAKNSTQDAQNIAAQTANDIEQLNNMYGAGAINATAYADGIDHLATAMINNGEVTQEAYENEVKAQKKAIKGTKEYKKAQEIVQDKTKKGTQEYKKAQKELKNLEIRAKANAQAAIKMGNAFNKVKGNLKDYGKAIEAGNKDPKKRQTQEYKDAIKNTQTAFKDGMNIKLNEEYIRKNWKTVKKAIEGDKDSIIKIRIEASKESLKADMQDAKEAVEKYLETANKELPKLEVGTVLTGKDALLSDMNEVAEKAAWTKAEANKHLHEIGMKGKLVKKHVPGSKRPVLSVTTTIGDAHPNVPGMPTEVAEKPNIDWIDVPGYDYWAIESAEYQGSEPSSSGSTGTSSSGGTGSKGGGGNKVAKMDNEYDPYEKWEERLTQIQKKLDDIAKISQNLDGEAYAKSLDKQNKLLEKRQKILKKEQKVAKKELNRSAKAMTGKAVKDSVTGETTNLKKAAKKAGLKYKPIYQKDENGKIMKDALGNKIVDNQKTRASMVKKANQKKGKAREKAQKFITDKLDPAISKNQESRDKYDEIDSMKKQEFEDWVQNRIDANSARFQVFVDTKQAQKDLDELNIDKLEQQLTKLDYKLSKTQRKLDNSIGTNKLAAYDEEQKIHTDKAQTYTNEAGQKKQEVDDDTENIQNAITKTNNLKNNNFPKGRQNKLKVIADNIKVGADGEITNGEAILKDLQKEEKRADDALAKKPTQSATAKWKEYKAAVKELYSYVQSELGEQSSDLKDYYSNISSADEERQAAEESAFAKFQYEWEIKVKDDEAKKAITQLGIELNKALQVEGDVFGKTLTGLDEAKNATIEFATTVDKATSVSARIDQEIAKGEFNTLSKTVEMAESTRESLQNSISTMTSQISNLISLIPEIIGKSYSIFEEWHSMLERSNKMIDAQSNIWKEFTDGSYSGLANSFLAQQTANAASENDVLTEMLPTYKENWKKSKVNFEEQQKTYYKSLTDNSLTADQKRQIAADYKIADEQFKADEKKYTQSLDQMVANVTTQISNSVTMMKNTICDIVEDSFADIAGQTLKASQTAYNWLQTTSKRYLDQTENPYQISQFSASAEKAIADTDAVSNQLRLTSVYKEQLKILQEKDKLTQYDVDRAQKLLDLEIKRQALEDARNNKASLKLRRDKSGNYSYQYVADEKKVAQAQSDYNKSKNDVYEMDKSNLASATSTFYSDIQAIQDELKKAYQAATNKNGEVDLEVFNAKRDEIKAKYQDAMSSNAAEVIARFNNLKQSSGLDWNNMDDTSRKSALRAAGIDPDILNTIKGFSDVDDWGTWFDSNFGEGSTYDETIKNTVNQMVTLEEQLKGLRETYEQNIPTATETMDKMQQAETEANTLRSQISGQIQSLLEQIKLAYESIDKLTIQIQKASNVISAINTSSTSTVSTSSDTSNIGTANTSIDSADGSEEQKKGSSGSAERDKSSGGGGGTKKKKSAPSKGDSVNVSKGALYNKEGKKKKEEVISPGGWKVVDIDKSKTHPYKVSKNGKEGWVALKRLSGFKSGGYTGKWNDITGEKDNGKLAWLHQKELILNAKDTENMLKTVGMVRDLTGMLKNMQLDAFHKTFGMLEKYIPSQPVGYTNTNNTSTAQTVHINANFPNANDSVQIEKAFKNLANIALQKAAKATDMTTAQTTL